MSIATAPLAVQPPRPVFEPLFRPPPVPMPPPEAAVPRAAAEPAVSAEAHRRQIAAAEHAAYERGVADGLLETAGTQTAKAREHLREVGMRMEALLADVAERERERALALDGTLGSLASRLAWGDDRRLLHGLFSRHLSAYVARLRAGELRSLAVSSPALDMLESDYPEFLAALRAAGVIIEAIDGEARAAVERSDGERIEIDFDALANDIRAALGGPGASADEGGPHE